ncbi:uncharacterized protein KD926_000817 [Aspergillus affinis]|uniref:uncharacterized protein n=1 Tax=Aspergillus affinis TaxID=1070780 RepID=UPI0022FECB1A|nr:uncharacterized protein KD926_000817 [Aspergillus affinis]KAI9037101.1 hypothetical protein KD926_000817 [Aspergillus affinis]
MSKGRGRQPVDRLALAHANGYVRGANRKKDQKYCETFYSDESKALQERVLSVYIVWVSEEDENIRKEGLREGQTVPDLATIKDFIRYYISSLHGIISLRSTKSSVLNFAERFFAGFTRLTKSTFDKKVTQNVYKLGLAHSYLIRRRKTSVVFDMKYFLRPAKLGFACAILQDIELYIYRRMDGEIELFFRLSEIWVKNNDNPKNTVFGGLSNSAWRRECFCRLFRATVINAGYPEIITIHTLRRGLANRLDKVAADSERSQILTQKDPNVFGRSYIDSTSALSSIDAFLGETMRLDHIEYLRGVGKYRAIGYPRTLPAERQHTITRDQDLLELEKRLKKLKIQETNLTGSGHS